jgi:hypothetical protein
MVGVVNKSKSASAETPVAPFIAADPGLEREKQRIQSPEFTQNLTASFHRSKRRALADGKQCAADKT